MAKCKIEWSIEAEQDLVRILEYYVQRNGNNTYSKKLYAKINKTLSIISKRPNIGIMSDYESVRALITGDYQIIYLISKDVIIVTMLWDCRRDPQDMKIGKRLSGK